MQARKRLGSCATAPGTSETTATEVTTVATIVSLSAIVPSFPACRALAHLSG